MSDNDNSGGPWGKGGNNGGGRNPWGGQNDDRGQKGNQPGNSQVPDIDEIVRKGQQQFKVLLGGKGGTGGSGGGSDLPQIGPFGWLLGAALVVGMYLYASFYQVQADEQSVELTFGEFSSIGTPGPNFAWWPVQNYEVVKVTTERSIEIGTSTRGGDNGLMLTGDENIVDIDFQVVWNVKNPEDYLFNLADPVATIRVTAESAMREIISKSELAPILNRDRGLVASEVGILLQDTLDTYASGVNIVRINLDRADPPEEVISAFRDVQAAEQERDQLQNEADRDANRTLAAARGESAEILQQAEAYRAQVVNEAAGQASRFNAVYDEYLNAPDVTRRRLYLETMEKVMGSVDKVIIDENLAGGEGGQGIVPYLPLNDLRGTK